VGEKSAAEILAAPPSALEGLTEKHDEVLAGLGIKTVGDLGKWKYAEPRGRAGGARRTSTSSRHAAGRVGCPALSGCRTLDLLGTAADAACPFGP
jgi:hypothetical protein